MFADYSLIPINYEKPLDSWINMKDGRRGTSVAILHQCQLRWQKRLMCLMCVQIKNESDFMPLSQPTGASAFKLLTRPSVVSVCLRLLKLPSPQPLWHHMKNQQRHVLKQILGVWDLLYYTPLATSSSGRHKLCILTASELVYIFSSNLLRVLSHNWPCWCLPNHASFNQDPLTLMWAKKDMETFSFSFTSYLIIALYIFPTVHASYS